MTNSLNIAWKHSNTKHISGLCVNTHPKDIANRLLLWLFQMIFGRPIYNEYA